MRNDKYSISIDFGTSFCSQEMSDIGREMAGEQGLNVLVLGAGGSLRITSILFISEDDHEILGFYLDGFRRSCST